MNMSFFSIIPLLHNTFLISLFKFFCQRRLFTKLLALRLFYCTEPSIILAHHNSIYMPLFHSAFGFKVLLFSSWYFTIFISMCSLLFNGFTNFVWKRKCIKIRMSLQKILQPTISTVVSGVASSTSTIQSAK